MIILETYSHLLSMTGSEPSGWDPTLDGRITHWYLVGRHPGWEMVVEAWIQSSLDRTGLKQLTLEVEECGDAQVFQPLVDWCSQHGVMLRFGVVISVTNVVEGTFPAERSPLVNRKELLERLQLPGDTSIPYAIIPLSPQTIDHVFPIWFWLVDHGLRYQFTLDTSIDPSPRERYAIAELLENLAHHPSLNLDWRYHYTALRRVLTGDMDEPDARYQILGSSIDEAVCIQAMRTGRVPLLPLPMPAVERWRALAQRFKLDKWSLLIQGFFALARLKLRRGSRAPASIQREDKKKALIIGWYGTETAGDKAILGGILEQLYTQDPGLQVSVASILPFYTRKTLEELEYGDIAEVVPYDFTLLRQLIPNVNLVVMGGGPLMDLVEMYQMLRVLEIARRQGVRTAIAGCGVGPALWPITRWAINGMLELSDRTILRDRDSLEQLQTWGSNINQVEIGLDPAIGYVAQLPGASLADRPASPVIGLGIRDWQRKFSRPMQSDVFEARRDELLGIYASACDDFIVTYRGAVHLIPMHTLHIGDDDRWIQAQIQQKVQYNELVRAHTASYSAAEIASLIQQCDIFISMRYHSLLFATILGIPVVAIDYTLGGKVASFAREQDVTDWVFDIRTLTHQALSDAISDIWTRKQEIKEKLRAKHDDLVERSNLAGLRVGELLQDIREKDL